VSEEFKADDERTLRRARRKKRLHIAGALLTLFGIGLFLYFVYSVGVNEIASNVERFGWIGFAVILVIYFARICIRATAWKMSVYEPYHLRVKDTIPAVIIGESLSSMIPLGIVVSGTAKAVAVKKHVPLVVGLSSVATENLFYSIATSIFLIFGALTFVRVFDLDPGWALTIDLLVVAIIVIVALLVIMIIRQWHFGSEICERLYRNGYFTGILEHGRLQVRLFENLIYGFYRQFPGRIVPIFLLEFVYHALGVLEVFFILYRITDGAAGALGAFLLESVSRLITILFKLVPFLIGVDEAGARFVAETLALGAAVGVTLAIIRKGRIVFWAGVGLLLIVKRGLSIKNLLKEHETAKTREQGSSK
jgi:hypothetical protein